MIPGLQTTQMVGHRGLTTRLRKLSPKGLVKAEAQLTWMRRMEAQRGKEKCCFNLSHLAIKYDFYFITRKKGLEGRSWMEWLGPSWQKNIFLRKYYCTYAFFPLFVRSHVDMKARGLGQTDAGGKQCRGVRMLVWELAGLTEESEVSAQVEKRALHYKSCWGQKWEWRSTLKWLFFFFH